MTNVTYQPTEEKILDIAPDQIEVLTFNQLVDINEISDTSIVNPSIQGGTLNVGSGDSVLKYDSRYGIWLGDANFADADFSVTMAGVLTASSIIVVGGTIRYGKTTFADTTNPGYYISSSGIHFGQSATSYLKYTIGGNLEWTGGAIDGTSTIGGRIASTLATAIDVSGHFADDAISTASGTILGEFNFTGSGALQIGTYEYNVTGDLKLSPTGILARDKLGATTFSINGETGVAVLNGLVVGTNVGLGTAQDSAGVTTIVGNVVTTGYVNALNITAQYVAASISITSPTITAGIIQTAATGLRTKMDSNGLWFGNSNTKYADIVVSYDSGGDEGEVAISTAMSGLSLTIGQGASPAGGFELGASSVGISAVGKSNLGSVGMNFGTGTGLGITWSGNNTSTRQIETDLRLGAHWLPHIDNTYDLGSGTYEWRNLYIDGTAYIDTLSVDAIGQTFAPQADNVYDLGTSAKQWRDVYINRYLYVNTANTGQALIVDGNFHLYTGSIDIKSQSGTIAWGGEICLQVPTSGGISTVITRKDFTPYADNTYKLGYSDKRWSDMQSVLINGADICFENNWTMTEHYMVGIKEKGIAILDELNDLVMFIGKKFLYTNKIKDISELKYTKTTQKERVELASIKELNNRLKKVEGV